MSRSTYPEQYFLNVSETAERILEILRQKANRVVTLNSIGVILAYEERIARQQGDPKADLRRTHPDTVCLALNDLLQNKTIIVEKILMSRMENDFTPFALMCMDAVIALTPSQLVDGKT